MSLLQWIILFTSVTGIGLMTQPWRPSIEKYAPVIGLISQPFWLVETFAAAQYGMFINSILITLMWCMGIYKYWIKRNYVNEKK